MSETSRLKAQCDAIINRLQFGPATNVELAKIALKYTGRISDLRKRGYTIQCVADRETGVSVYTLVGGKEHVPDQVSLFKKRFDDPA